MGCSEGSSEMEVHSNTGLPKKDRNISNKQPKPTCTITGGTKTNKNELTTIKTYGTQGRPS